MDYIYKSAVCRHPDNKLAKMKLSATFITLSAYIAFATAQSQEFGQCWYLLFSRLYIMTDMLSLWVVVLVGLARQ